MYKENLLKQANQLLINKDYINAETKYLAFLQKFPEFEPFLFANLNLISKKLLQNKNRVAVFASYSKNNIVEDYVVYYLKKLKQICKLIIFCNDNELSNKELSKLKGIVDYTIIGRHNEYDFGSYKRGIQLLESLPNYNSYEDLILCNDSCYGPINNFYRIFYEMDKKNLDFWGLTQNSKHQVHLQSYFIVYSNKVFTSSIFRNFFRNVKQQKKAWDVIKNYEIPFTQMLQDYGYCWDSFISVNDKELQEYLTIDTNLTIYFPYSLLNKSMELVKVKCLIDISKNKQLNQTIQFIKDNNYKLYKMLPIFVQ